MSYSHHACRADHHHHHHHDHPAVAVEPAEAGERATTLVLALTVVTMVVEIGAGWWTGSMALLADGWHMAMHAAAMGVAVFAYRFARQHRHSARYAFGAGKAADLGAFANAVLLAAMAVLIAGESTQRLFVPGSIDFGAALLVAVIGLGVNLVSAWLLRAAPHAHGCSHHHHAHDHNREAAFVHVLSDALTSALAIVALWCGREYGILWLDPLMGLVGAVVILRWSVALFGKSGAVLLDASPGRELEERVRAIVAEHGDELQALRIWPVAAGRWAVMIAAAPTGRAAYRPAIQALPGVDYVAIDRALDADPAEHDRHHHHS